jgi:tRNA pseudouridine55 synthase
MDGLILIHKPADVTSHDVIAELRKVFCLQKIGHFGTLDPMATGLLLVAVGKATKFFPFFSKIDKSYQGRIRLGFSTDTYDSSGIPLGVDHADYPNAEAIRLAMTAFEGEIDQVAPPFSAKKYKGRPLYAFARKKCSVELQPFRRKVHFFRFKNYAPPYLDFEAKCSSGTYIRTLAHDLGRQLGCGAHLVELIRTEVGDYRLADGFSLEEIKTLFMAGQFDRFLKPLESLLPAFPKIVLRESGRLLVQNGRPVFPEHLVQPPPGEPLGSPDECEPQAVFRLFSQDGRLIALAMSSHPPSLSPILVLT